MLVQMPYNARAGVTAIVVTYESADVLPACLAALNAEGIDVIVVDNASRDTTQQIAAGLGARVIANRSNQGYGRANNAGVRAAEGAAFCLIVNPDVVIAPGLVDAFLAASRTYPHAAAFGPRLVEPDGRIFFRATSILAGRNAGARAAPPSSDCEMVNVSGACLFVRRDMFLKLGGFDENIFLFYEDDDLCYRVIESGSALMHINGAAAQHLRGGSSGKGAELAFKIRYHQAWSRAYVCRKHNKPTDMTAMLLRNAVKYAGAVLAGNADRRARYGGSVAGTLDAMRRRSALKHEGLS